MGAAVRWGVILAAAVTVFNTIWVLAGLHTSLQAATGYLAVVTILDVIAVILALRATAEGSPYLRQLLAGLVLGIVGGTLIFLTSWSELSFVFPEAIPDQIAAFKAAYEALPIPDDQKQETMQRLESVTPLNSAFQGAVGALATSIIAGAIAGIFLRKR